MKEQEEAIAAIGSLFEREGELYMYSLDPHGGFGYHANNKGIFHGFKILGFTRIKVYKVKIELLKALVKGMRDNNGWVAMCFNSRHGVRFKDSTQDIDLVICFECASACTYGINNGEGFLLAGYA